MKGVKKLFKVVWKTVKWSFIVFCVYTASLFFREQKLPGWAIDAVLRKVSCGDCIVACDDVFFGFRSGLRIERLKVFDRSSVRGFDPALSAKTIEIDVFARVIRIAALRLPFLHDGYYEAGIPQEKNSPLSVEFPNLPAFRLELDRPYVLGVAPVSVSCFVDTSPLKLSFSNIELQWPDDGADMKLRGFCDVDLSEQQVRGEVKGLARQAHIRPLVEVLDVPSALPYMDAFTEVSEPVPAFCGWDVNLVNNDFRLELDLKPTMGRYNGVPMSRVDGKVGLYVYTRGTNLNFSTRIGPLKAWDLDGELMLDGQLTVNSTNDVCSIDFDACGDALPKHLTTVIDFLNGGALDCYVTTNHLGVSVSGLLATDLARQSDNALGGHLDSSDCVLVGVPFKSASTDYAYLGDTVHFTNLSAVCAMGGKISGSAAVHVPGLDEERDSFDVDIRYSDGTLGELADALGIELSDRTGRIEAALRMSAPLSSNLIDSVVAEGRVDITDAMLWRLKFFDAITSMLHVGDVPGVGAIAGLSDSASGDFVISNGVLRSENIIIEGPFLSIKAWGGCDLKTGELDFIVRMQPLRKNIAGLPIGDVVHFVAQPLTRTLEYRVTGTPDDPKWQSRWLEKIVDTVKDSL